MLKVVGIQRTSVRYAGWNIFGKGANKADMYEVKFVDRRLNILMVFS